LCARARRRSTSASSQSTQLERDRPNFARYAIV
jgi:hypothetical protein